jgi:GntR family transcriptional regulator, vanillate catabolism transcriptional regulator
MDLAAMHTIGGLADAADRFATRSQSVTDALREMIVQGTLKPGDHVQEVRVAQQLNVSRTPVRTALTTLANEGFLLYQPNRGFSVRRFDIADIMEAYEIRATLEGLAARRAAERGISVEQQALVERCIERGDAILDKGRFEEVDLAPYRAMNVGVHETIIEAAGSERLADMIRQTYNIPLVSDRIILWGDFSILRRSHDDHHRVLAAILHREAWRAESLMREHVYYAGIALRDHLDRHGGLDATAGMMM